MARIMALVRWLIRVDVRLTRRLALVEDGQRWRNPFFWLAMVGAHAGDSLLWAGITVILWQQSGEDPARKRQIVGWIVSFIAALMVTLSIKRVFKRRRPGTGQFFYGRGADVHSFPSGHGARSGTILVWASILHPAWARWAPLLILWIGWSRIATGVHYVGDVVIGFILGLGLSGLIRRLWQIHP
ncbi:MAG: phosphatase PAP2 family protein [Caldilineaceae bacterium]|nr:phosphatase PAP2 family protein [Caldilineaceae bacterium]